MVTEKLRENRELFKKWVREYGAGLKIKEVFNDDDSNVGFYAFMVMFKEFLYSSIHNYLSPNKYDRDYEETIRLYCKFIEEKILPICKHKIEHYQKERSLGIKQHIYINKWLDLEDDYNALASYRNIKLFALYLERGKPTKLWKNTIHLFENFFEYSQRVVYGEKIELIRASYFPGAGKTYAGNILCAWWFGYDEEMSILRITYSEDLCTNFIRQIADIIDSEQYRKVFPRFNVGEIGQVGNSELYSEFSISVGFKFKFSTVKNFYSSTREGQATGKRAKVLMIDDLIKGAIEAYNEKLHLDLVNKYDTEWKSRSDTSYQPVIALGTMWATKDLLNVLYQRAKKDTDNNFKFDNRYKYTEIAINDDGTVNSVFIATPILDYDTDESTCPLRFTTKDMKKMRDHMEEELWNAVYQQRPIPPSEFMFDYRFLETYTLENLPKQIMNNVDCQTWAFIDPTRKGADYFAMGIFRRYRLENGKWSKWYLINCIFEQKATTELYYDIAYAIINNDISKLGYENNIDISFEDLVKYKVKELNGKLTFKIESFFSSGSSKETKIRSAASGIKKEIIFPSMTIYSANSPMGKGMDQFTTWNLSRRVGDHDDFPDMLSMFVKYFCDGLIGGNTMTVLDRSIFSLR